MDLLDYVYEQLLTNFGSYYETMEYIDNIKNIRYRNKAGITIYRIKTTPKPFSIGGKNYEIKSEISLEVKCPDKRIMADIEDKIYDVFDQRTVYYPSSTPYDITNIQTSVETISFKLDKLTVSQMTNVDGSLVYNYTPEITGNYIYEFDMDDNVKIETYLKVYDADGELYDTTDIKTIYSVPSILSVGDYVKYLDNTETERTGRIFKIEDNNIYLNNSKYYQLMTQVIANNDITKENHGITQQAYIIKSNILLIR